jgi:hypothetical protein
MQDIFRSNGAALMQQVDPSQTMNQSGITFHQKDRFGGEENDGSKTGPIMQKRFKRTTQHFYA